MQGRYYVEVSITGLIVVYDRITGLTGRFFDDYTHHSGPITEFPY